MTALRDDDFSVTTGSGTSVPSSVGGRSINKGVGTARTSLLSSSTPSNTLNPGSNPVASRATELWNASNYLAAAKIDSSSGQQAEAQQEYGVD